MKFPALSLSAKVGILLFLTILGTYAFTAAPYNPGYADSDEVITIGYLLGSAHPSGYPLQMWLTKLFTMLPIPGSIAFRANLLNCFFSSLTVLFLYKLGLLLISYLSKENKESYYSQQNVLISATAALMVGFSGLFWMYAGVAEKVSLTAFFTVTVVYYGFLWLFSTKSEANITRKEILLFLLTVLISGLGLTHAQTFIFLYPGLMIMLLAGLLPKKRWKLYGWKIPTLGLLVFGLAFMLPNVSLFYLNSRQQNVSWYFDQSMTGWWHHITRRVYSGFIPEKNINVTSYVGHIDVGKYIKAFPYYWRFLTDHMTVIGVLVGLMGLIYIWIRDRMLALISNTIVLMSGLLFTMYMGVAEYSPANLEYRSLIGISHRQYLIGEAIWGLAIILGLWALVDVVKESAKRITASQLTAATMLVSSIFILITISSNASMGYERNNTHAWDYGHAVLSQLPQDAVAMCFADFSCFSLMYVQEVEGYRPDVKLVSKNIYIKGHWLRKNTWLKGLEDADNPYFSADVISWNLYQGRRVFITDSVGYYVGYIGLEGNPFFIIPNGYSFEVVKKVPDQVQLFEYPLTEKLLRYNRPAKDYWFAGQKDYFSNFHSIMALVYGYLGNKEGAMRNIKLALALTPDYPTAQQIYKDLPSYKGNPNYRLGQESSPSSYYLDQAKLLIGKNQLDPGFKSLQKATFLDPASSEARSTLAELLVSARFYPEAIMEYKNLLRFHPENETVRKRLAEIQALAK